MVIPGGGDWTPLFNGHDLKGWHATDAGRWTTDANAATLIGHTDSGKRGGSWLLTDREFGDFRLAWSFNWPRKPTADWVCGRT